MQLSSHIILCLSARRSHNCQPVTPCLPVQRQHNHFFTCPVDTQLHDVYLQVVLFLTHTVTGISIWSWLLLSTLRYLAIRHPLFHLRLWQMPCRALSFIVVCFILFYFGLPSTAFSLLNLCAECCPENPENIGSEIEKAKISKFALCEGKCQNRVKMNQSRKNNIRSRFYWSEILLGDGCRKG